MTDFVFVTGNQKKADYLARWLDHPVEHQKVDLDELQSLDLREVITHKAQEAYRQLGRTVLVEDVSLVINAFGGLPGTFIKYFLEEMGPKGIVKMLHSFDDRSVSAKIAYGLYDGNELHIFEGQTDGMIAPEPRVSEHDGWHGTLSWNSIFVPNGSDKTYAEMTDEELQPVSHRAKAIAELQEYLTLVDN